MLKLLLKKEGEDKANVILKNKQNEEVRNSHRQIKYARKKVSGGGTTKLHIPDENGDIIEINDKVSIEIALMKYNEINFR